MSNPAGSSAPWQDGRNSIHFRPSSSPHSWTAAEKLTDDLIVEILSRVPARSLCRFKCTSNHWLNLIDHPDHRKKLPQTLAGFFYSKERPAKSAIRFTNIPGRRCPPIDTSFAFLPNHRRVDLLDCCRGLVLCRWYDATTTRDDKFRYVVCNPATEKWAALPESIPVDNLKVGTVRLGFDPAVSSHFYVFLLLEEAHVNSYVTRVDVYSSQTGRWVSKDERWNEDIIMLTGLQFRSAVFLNGSLHFHAFGDESCHCIAAVDTEAQTWTILPIHDGELKGFIQQSQGYLHYSNFQKDEGDDVVQLVVYVLKDYDSKEWILKHTEESLRLFGGISDVLYGNFEWIAIHPECNLIFFTTGREDASLMCYSMNHRQVKVISSLEYGDFSPYLAYVPLYAELHSLHT